MKIYSTTMINGSNIEKMATIEYEGAFWLVPYWLDNKATGMTSPGRIIPLASFEHQKTQDGFLIPHQVPKFLFSADALPSEAIKLYGVIDNPPIQFRRGN